MATSDLIQTLAHNVDNLRSFNLEDLVRTRSLGQSYNFTILNQEFILAKILLDKTRLLAAVLPQAPDVLIQDLNSKIISLTQATEMITTFQPSSVSSQSIRDSIVLTYKSAFENFVKATIPVFQIISIIDADNVDQLRKKELEFDSYMDNAKTEIETKLKAIENVVNSFNDRNKDLGVAKYAKVFDSESKTYWKSSVVWLCVSIFFFVCIVSWMTYLATSSMDTVTADSLTSDNTIVAYFIIQKVITKILIASALFYGLAFSVKGFRANRHNSIVNKHRQSALETFEAFVNAPSADQGTKNAVLLEATRTIFSHNTTGYDTSDKDSEMSNKIIEIIKPMGNG